MKKMGDDDKMGESVKGGFSYTDDEGNKFSVQYTADENGYRPVRPHIPWCCVIKSKNFTFFSFQVGAHLPVGPTIPPQIARALAWQATAKPWVDPSLKRKKKKVLDEE